MRDIQMPKGDTLVFDVDVTRTDPVTGLDAPVNLTGAKAWFTAKRSHYDIDSNAIIKYDTTSTPSNITIFDAANGIVRVTIAPADTNTTVYRWLVYDVQIKEVSGAVSTVARGKIELLPQATITTA